jgi:putative tryptophan/tyrosine transport system substrate-binding protein
VKRREFITLLGSAAVWPLTAHAQQPTKLPTIGLLGSSTLSAWSNWVAAFVQRLRQLGWIEGRTIAIEYRWAEGRSEHFTEMAAEFVRMKVDIIVTGGTAVPAAKLATSTIPIVFPVAADPVGGGLVASLARPGGNVTGFMLHEYSIGVKLLELLKEIAPGVTRVAVLRDSASPSQAAQFGVIQAVGPMFKAEVSPVDMRDAGGIERTVETFARSPGGGLIVVGSGASIRHRDLIVGLAARHKLPAVYWERFFVVAGGLLSYGANTLDQYRRAAGYIDRILKGEKPGDLPVQAPNKYELAINLKTANALGLSLPLSLQQRADEVVE